MKEAETASAAKIRQTILRPQASIETAIKGSSDEVRSSAFRGQTM
jgi:hypothetical protein